MKDFQFRMQVVLDQRERVERAAKQSLGEAEAALRRAEEFLRELRDVRAALLAELCGRGVFDPSETRLYHDYMQNIVESIRTQEAHVRELTIAREAHKLCLIGAAQNRQALAGVRDRHQEAHALGRQRAEQSALDELATTGHNHRLRAHSEAA